LHLAPREADKVWFKYGARHSDHSVMKSALSVAFVLTVLLTVANAEADTVQLGSVQGDPAVASAQVALRERGLYGNTIDGLLGPTTRQALSQFQRQSKLTPTGRLDRRTRQVLDPIDRSAVSLSLGAKGLPVAALQFRLAWHGFPSGSFTTDFSARIDTALRKFQAWSGLVPDGVVGAKTVVELRQPPATTSLALSWPLVGRLGDRFGPRGDRFHTGIDISGPTGAPVAAAASGVVVQSGWLRGGWGKTVTIEHAPGVQTAYAHLSAVAVAVGATIQAGFQIGLVGSTGDATGPHLHFEERLRGAAIDPLRNLPLQG
jgi:murein DD-endopeptidase MepM/ murein hydrolase activator NlpD